MDLRSHREAMLEYYLGYGRARIEELVREVRAALPQDLADCVARAIEVGERAIAYRKADMQFAAEILRPESLWASDFEKREGRRPRREERDRAALEAVGLTIWDENILRRWSKPAQAFNVFAGLVLDDFTHAPSDPTEAMTTVAEQCGYRHAGTAARSLRRFCKQLQGVPDVERREIATRVLALIPDGRELERLGLDPGGDKVP